jgi:hypothetical protein
MALYDDIQSSLDVIIADYKAKSSDGTFTFSEIFSLLTNAVGTLVKLVEGVGGYSGKEKKQAVLSAIDRFFDEVIAPLDIKAIPNIVEGILDNAIKQLVLTAADGLIDALVNIFNKVGWDRDDAGPQDAMSSQITVF